MSPTLGVALLTVGIMAIIGAIYAFKITRAAIRGGDRFLSAYSGHRAWNFIPEHNNATIIVHGLEGSSIHKYGEQDPFIAEMQQRAPDQDYFFYVWSGFHITPTALPSSWDIHNTHAIAVNGLKNVIKAFQSKGYDNINIISHSWGTVISRDALNSCGGEINTWFTMGSPLTANTQKPGNVQSWHNLWHKDDIVDTTAPYALGGTGAGSSGKPLYEKRGNIFQHQMPGDYDPMSLEAHGIYWHITASLNILGGQLSQQ